MQIIIAQKLNKTNGDEERFIHHNIPENPSYAHDKAVTDKLVALIERGVPADDLFVLEAYDVRAVVAKTHVTLTS